MGRFIKGDRYISSNFLNKDGTWDYGALQKHFREKSAFHPNEDCLPIQPSTSLPERLEELGGAIDLERRTFRTEE